METKDSCSRPHLVGLRLVVVVVIVVVVVVVVVVVKMRATRLMMNMTL